MVLSSTLRVFYVNLACSYIVDFLDIGVIIYFSNA